MLNLTFIIGTNVEILHAESQTSSKCHRFITGKKKKHQDPCKSIKNDTTKWCKV